MLQCVTAYSWIPPQRIPGPAMENQGLIKEKKNNDTFSLLLHCCRHIICRAFLTDELTTSCSTSPVAHSEKQAEETEDNGLCLKRHKTPGSRTREGGLRSRDSKTRTLLLSWIPPVALGNILRSCPQLRSGRALHMTRARSKTLKESKAERLAFLWSSQKTISKILRTSDEWSSISVYT